MSVRDRNKVFVMNQKTKDQLIEKLYKTIQAKGKNLMAYIKVVGEMNIVVDEELGDEVIEIYDKVTYYGEYYPDPEEYTDE